MNMLFLFFTFAFSTILMKEGGGSTDTYVNWVSVDDCAEGSTFKEADDDGIVRIAASDIPEVKDRTIILRGGETAEITLYTSLTTTPKYYLKKTGSSNEKVTFKLNIPYNTQPFELFYYDCEGYLDDVHVTFLKKTSTDTGLPPLMYFKNGPNFAGDNKVNYVFHYEGAETEIDFSNYAIPVMQERTSYTLAFADMAQYEFTQAVLTNIGQQSASISGTFENYHENTKVGFSYEYVTNPSEDASRNWFEVCQITKTATVNCGYLLDQTSYEYVCQEGDTNLLKPNTEGVYEFSKNQFASDAENTEFIVFVEGGHSVSITLDNDKAIKVKIAKGSTLPTDEKFSVSYIVKPTESAATLSFDGCEGSLGDVLMYFNNGDTASTRVILIEGGVNFVGPIKYIMSYESSATLTSFENYAVVRFTTSDKYKIKLDFPETLAMSALQMNIQKQNTESVTLPGLKEYELLGSDQKRLYYTFEEVDVDASNKIYGFKITSDVSGTKVWGYKLEGTNYIFSKDIAATETKIGLFDHQEQAYTFNGVHLASTESWPTFNVFAEGGHKILFTMDNTNGFDIQVTKGSTLGSNEKISVKYIIPATGSQFGIAYWGCDGMLNDVEMYFQKGTAASTRPVWVKSGWGHTIPIDYVISYEVEEDATTIDFSLYAVPTWQENKLYTMKLADIPNIKMDNVATNLKITNDQFAIPGTMQTHEGCVEYFYIYSVTNNQIYLLKATAFTGFKKSESTEDKYVRWTFGEKQCKPIDECIIENDDGIYVFDQNSISVATDVKTEIVTGNGNTVNVKFDFTGSAKIELKSVEGTTVGSTYTFNIPSTADAVVTFNNAKIEKVDINLQQGTAASTTFVELQSDATNKNKYNVKYVLGDGQSEFDFAKFVGIKMTTSNNYEMNIQGFPKNEIATAISTNINVVDATYVVPTTTEAFVLSGKTYTYVLTIESTIVKIKTQVSTNVKVGGYCRKVLESGNYDFVFSAESAEGTEGCVFQGDDEYYQFDSTLLLAGTTWKENYLKLEPSHKARVVMDFTGNANVYIQKGNTVDSLEKITAEIVIPGGIDSGFSFTDNDGWLNDVKVIFKKGGNGRKIYSKGGCKGWEGENCVTQYDTPIHYVFEYEYDYDENTNDNTINFAEYAVLICEKGSSFDMKFGNFKSKLVFENEYEETNIGIANYIATKIEDYEDIIDDKRCYFYFTYVEKESWYNRYSVKFDASQQKLWGYTLKSSTYKYSKELSTETGNVLFDPSINGYIFEVSSNFKIEVEGGHEIQVTTNTEYTIEIASGTKMGNSKKYKCNFIIAAESTGSLKFTSGDGLLEDVDIKLMKGTAGANPFVILSGENFENTINYKITYELTAAEEQQKINFANYGKLKFDGDKQYSIELMNIPAIAMEKETTNLLVQANDYPTPTKKPFINGDFVVSHTYEISNSNEITLIVTAEEFDHVPGYVPQDGKSTDTDYASALPVMYVFNEYAPSIAEGLVTENADGVYVFEGNKFVSDEQCGKQWPEGMIAVHPGHKIKIVSNANGCVDYWLMKPEGAQGQAGEVTFVLSPDQQHSSLSLYKNADGYYNDIVIEMNQAYAYDNSKVYIKTSGENQFTNKVNYKLKYNGLEENSDTIPFDMYSRVAFEGSDDYTMELVNFPVTFRSYLGKSMNIYPKTNYPIPQIGQVQDGDKTVDVTFAFGSTTVFTHVDVLKITAWAQGETVTGKSGMYREDEWTFDYVYKEVIPDADDYYSYIDNNNVYVFNSENASPFEEKTTIHPGPNSKVTVKFDRKESDDSLSNVRLEYHLIADKDYDFSQTELNVQINVNRLDGILKVKQVENKFQKPIHLQFDQAQEESDLTERGVIYLKGNYDDNTVDAEDKIERVKYQVEYKYDGKGYFNFKKFKSVYFQEYHEDKNGKGGFTIEHIFFNGYYPEFPDPTPTNLYANNAGTVHNENQEEVQCPQLIKKIQTPAYPVYRKKSIRYTLSYNDGMEEQLAEYNIQSEWIEADNPDKPEEEGTNKDDGTTSVFALMILLMLFFLF